MRLAVLIGRVMFAIRESGKPLGRPTRRLSLCIGPRTSRPCPPPATIDAVWRGVGWRRA